MNLGRSYLITIVTRSSIYARELTLFSQLTRLHKDDAVTGQANVLGKILGQILPKSNFVVSLTHWHCSTNYVHLSVLAPHLNFLLLDQILKLRYDEKATKFEKISDLF